MEAAALAHARGAAFFVFRQLLRGLAGIDSASDLAATRDALHRRLWDLSPELAARAPDILPVLGTAGETPAQRLGSTDDRKDRLRESVVAWLEAECRRRPRVVLVEDLQWLDPSSEELLGHVALEARRMPLLLLMTSRLPIAGSNLELARIREVPLPALSPDDVQQLAAAQVDPYPAGPRLRAVVAERSEGNPFYVEELVRAFREHDQLVLDHGSYELRPAAEHTLPATINALIASRIDRLPLSARELMSDAAVLGTHFPLAHLRAMAGSEQFEEDLALAERRGLLDRQAKSGVAGLRFRHVLTQEVVYGSLLQGDRQGRHRRAADTLERLYGGRRDEVCDQLAHQWSHSDQGARAFPYLVTAADAAVVVGASQEAIGHLQAALDLAGKHEGTASREESQGLRLKLAGLHFIVGER